VTKQNDIMFSCSSCPKIMQRLQCRVQQN